MRRLLLAGLLLVTLAAPASAQQCGVFKVWTASEVLTSADLNASFQRTVDANVPQCIDDYSATVSQMQSTVNPFPGGIESLPTKLSGELERIRFQLKAIIGGAQWYSVPVRSLAPSTSIQLAEIATPSTPPTDNVKLYARDQSGTSVLSYVDAAGAVRTLLTSDIASTVSFLTMVRDPVVGTPPSGNIAFYAVGDGTGGPGAYLAYKDSSGQQELIPRASEQKGNTGLAGLIITRTTNRILTLTVDRIVVQGYPLFSVNNTVNLDLTGAGGRGCVTPGTCDALTPNTPYYIFLIYNGTTRTRSMLATLDLGPIAAVPTKLPAGTTNVRLVGMWRTDASSNLLDGFMRDVSFTYATPRLVAGCCAIGSGTLDLVDTPVTVTKAHLLVKFAPPQDTSPLDGVPDAPGMAVFRAHYTTIVGGLASVVVSTPVVAAQGIAGLSYVANATLSLGNPAALPEGPFHIHWEVDLMPVTLYVTGWEMQTRDP